MFAVGTPDDRAYIAEFESDDDASLQAVLQHFVEDSIKVGTMTNEEWPRYKNGVKKPDNEQLPVNHLSITFLADRRSCKEVLCTGCLVKGKESWCHKVRCRTNKTTNLTGIEDQDKWYL
jgi:hypothetical protein